MAIDLKYWRYVSICAVISAAVTVVSAYYPMAIIVVYITRWAMHRSIVRIYSRDSHGFGGACDGWPVLGGVSFTLLIAFMVVLGVSDYAASLNANHNNIIYPHASAAWRGEYYCRFENNVVEIFAAVYCYTVNIRLARKPISDSGIPMRIVSISLVSIIIVFFYIFSEFSCERVFANNLGSAEIKTFQAYWLIVVRAAMVAAVGFGVAILLTSVERILSNLFVGLRR